MQYNFNNKDNEVLNANWLIDAQGNVMWRRVVLQIILVVLIIFLFDTIFYAGINPFDWQHGHVNNRLWCIILSKIIVYFFMSLAMLFINRLFLPNTLQEDYTVTTLFWQYVIWVTATVGVLLIACFTGYELFWIFRRFLPN